MELNEAALYVIKSCQAPLGTLEQFFVGWYVYRVTATPLVFTNLRLLHFGVGPGGKWNRTLKSVRWGDVTSACCNFATRTEPGTGGSRKKTARKHQRFSKPCFR